MHVPPRLQIQLPVTSGNKEKNFVTLEAKTCLMRSGTPREDWIPFRPRPGGPRIDCGLAKLLDTLYGGLDPPPSPPGCLRRRQT